MLKKSALLAILLSSVMAFSINADDKTILKHISVSPVSASPIAPGNVIAGMTRKYSASPQKVASMRIDNSSTAAAILYK